MSASVHPVRVIVGVDGSGRSWRIRHEADRLGGESIAVPRGADAGAVRTLLEAGGDRTTVVVDDAHLAAPDVLAEVLAAAARGSGLLLARGPEVTSAELADVEDAALQAGRLVTLGALDAADIEAMLARTAPDGRADAAQVEALLGAGGGVAWVTSALVSDVGQGAGDGGALDAAIQRRLTRLPAPAAELATLLAVWASGAAELRRAGTPGRALPAGLSSPDLGVAAARHLHRSGFLDPAARAAGHDRLVPAVAARLRAGLTGTELAARQAVLDSLAGADSARLSAAHLAAAEGRTARVADHLAGAETAAYRLLAVPALVGLGRLALAAALCEGTDLPGDHHALTLARAVVSVADRPPLALLPALIEAAERGSGTSDPVTPQALLASLAVAAGDAETAERVLLGSAGSPATDPAGGHHRYLAAWVRLRSGRPDAALQLLGTAGAVVQPREELLRTALLAGIARRRGDVVALRSCWDDVAHALARRSADLWSLEAVEELVMAAVRLDLGRRAQAMRGDLEELAPPGVAMWQVALAWLDLQVAVVGDDAAAAQVAADRLAAGSALPTAGARQAAQARAAQTWATVLDGKVDSEAVLGAVDDLVDDAQLPWEASRLAGQAAVRSSDAAVAKRLLERARELSGGGDQRAVETAGPGNSAGAMGVSERELEVAQLVLAGRTHREIGAQLYISPKTVEHHVARIKTKLGARDRAEFMAGLRSLVDGHDQA